MVTLSNTFSKKRSSNQSTKNTLRVVNTKAKVVEVSNSKEEFELNYHTITGRVFQSSPWDFYTSLPETVDGFHPETNLSYEDRWLLRIILKLTGGDSQRLVKIAKFYLPHLNSLKVYKYCMASSIKAKNATPITEHLLHDLSQLTSKDDVLNLLNTKYGAVFPTSTERKYAADIYLSYTECHDLYS